MWIDRQISKKILKAAKEFPALVLTGGRQAGKTELLKHLFPQYAYVSLDLPSLAAQAEHAPAQLLQNNPLPVIIDEVQYAPSLFRHLKTFIDRDRHKTGQILLTGSQKFTLMKEISESLAGRCAVFDLETLGLKEMLSAGAKFDAQPDIIQILTRGGFPDLWRDKNINASTFYSSYLATYLERDVRQLINIVSLRDFERFLRACAVRNGQILEKSSLASDVGISTKAVNDWLSVLQASNQISLLEPWFGNFSKRLIKSPKLYFNDAGLVCFLLGQTKDSLAQGPFLGAVWETFIYAELRKYFQSSSQLGTIWFYRDAQGREIDFLLQTENKNFAIECKWHEAPTLKDGKSITELQAYLAKKPHPLLANLRGYILCRPPAEHPLGQNLRGISLPAFMKKLGREK